jgi:hypothetical protein
VSESSRSDAQVAGTEGEGAVGDGTVDSLVGGDTEALGTADRVGKLPVPPPPQAEPITRIRIAARAVLESAFLALRHAATSSALLLST